MLKHTGEDENITVDLDQEGLDTSSAEETEIGAREDLQPDNLGASSEMTIGGPRNEPDCPLTSLGATETGGHQQQPDDKYCSKWAKKISACKKVYLEHYLRRL